MTFEEIIKIATTILLSLGSGGIIVLALSNFLGKVWANRIMDQERSRFERELAELRSKLEKDNQENLSKLHTDLEIYRDTYLKAHNDKLTIYRLVTDIVAELLADIDLLRLGQQPQGNFLDRFNRSRLKAHGYLAMLAPQNVMDAWDELIEFLVISLAKSPPDDAHERWKEMRRRAYILINVIREDVGVNKNKIEYRGNQ
jgi:hypothetical protein